MHFVEIEAMLLPPVQILLEMHSRLKASIKPLNVNCVLHWNQINLLLITVTGILAQQRLNCCYQVIVKPTLEERQDVCRVETVI